MVMVFCLMPPPITAEAADYSGTYRVYDDEGSYVEKTFSVDQINNPAMTYQTELDSGTYYVSKDYKPSDLTINGDVDLIIPKGVTLDVLTELTIECPVTQYSSTLNIYGSGKLLVGSEISCSYNVNINLHGVTVETDWFKTTSLTVYAGRVSAKEKGLICTDLTVHGGTVEAKNNYETYSPAISVSKTFTVGKNGSVSGYSSVGTAAFSMVPTVNYNEGYDKIVSFGDSEDNCTTAANTSIDDELIKNHYVSIAKGKASVDYISRGYDPTTGAVTDVQSSASNVLLLNSLNQPTTLTGWYYVDETADLSCRPVVDGTANIILKDGVTLYADCGINVADGNTLNIYSQTADGDGTVTAHDLSIPDKYKTAFIGGDEYEKCGTIKLFGGNIKTLSDFLYTFDLIGSGNSSERGAGDVYVYGGSIDAQNNGMVITAKLHIYSGEVSALSCDNPITNQNALYAAPEFGKDYIPTAEFGSTAANANKKMKPDSKVYTSYKYIHHTNI